MNARRHYEFCKRLCDIVTSVAALVALSPLLLVLALAVRFRLGSPILFRQQRPGLRERTFVLLKFRTMSVTADNAGSLMTDEERLSAFGRWLRSTSLDELPELFNVLVGDMSLVGPRPLLLEYLPLYSGEQARRQAVRPGITGWAQVNGRNAISWDEKFKLDIWYVDNRSFRLDMKILFMTIAKVIRQEAISQDGQATMTRFTGSGT